MVAFFDELKSGRQEIKNCPEKGCKYASSNKSDLKDHFNSRHIHYFAFKCDICDEYFYTRRNYNRHRKMKHKQELIVAAINDGTLKRPREEEEEEAEESKEEISKLSIPAVNESTIFKGNPKEAFDSMSLYFKKLKICKQELIKCPEKNCQYTCNNKTDLKGHMNSRHIHYLTVKCEICSELFYTQKALHSHKKNRHGIVSTAVTNSKSNCSEGEEDNIEQSILIDDSSLSGTQTPTLLASSEDLLNQTESLYTNPPEQLTNQSYSQPIPIVTFQTKLESLSKFESVDSLHSDIDFEDLSDISETYTKDYLETECEFQWNGPWNTN